MCTREQTCLIFFFASTWCVPRSQQKSRGGGKRREKFSTELKPKHQVSEALLDEFRHRDWFVGCDKDSSVSYSGSSI